MYKRSVPTRHHIACLCAILDPVAGDPRWKDDLITYMGMAASFVAGFGGTPGKTTQEQYPQTIRRMKRIVGDEMIETMLKEPPHPYMQYNWMHLQVVAVVFGELVSQAHDIAVESEGEWHECAADRDQIKDLLGAAYYAVRVMSDGSTTAERGLELAYAYME